MRYSQLVSFFSGLTLALASPAPAASSTTSAAATCTSGSRIINNKACWVACGYSRGGNQYKQTLTKSLEACLQLCYSDSQCTTAQYRNDNGYCYLKNVRFTPTTSTVADTVDCDINDYTPSAANCPSGKRYKIHVSGTTRYAYTGNTYLSFPPNTPKANGTTYELFVDPRGACAIRPVGAITGGFIGFSNLPAPDEGGAGFVQFNTQINPNSQQPITCIKNANSQLVCRLEQDIAWNKITLGQYQNIDNVLLSNESFLSFDDPAIILVLEEV